MTTPLRLVIAPSGFKESLSADAVAGAIAAGVRRVAPTALLDTVPLVDGGEGSARALAENTGGGLIPVTVTGPVGDPVVAPLALLGGPGPRTAVVEMAAAAGLRLVPADRRDPGRTTTYGVGELIRSALDLGCARILVGCGDSGTCDGGAGALSALGAKITDADGRAIPFGGYALNDAVSLDTSGLDPRLRDTELVVACNPCNVLTGDRGVATVFGPQKGATPAQVAVLSAAMDRWAALLDGASGKNLRLVPGGGASGGLGAGLAGGLGARLRSRFDVLLDQFDLNARISTADLVITAEGTIDAQTVRGKVPGEVARLAKRHDVPVIALAGTIGEGADATRGAGIDAFTGILAAPGTLADAIGNAEALLTNATERALRLIMVGTHLPDLAPRCASGLPA
ncbi:glycerate kinase [Amycolatopsis sp. YIM 10]|uniref:glycerate kinase family protein n=1 Tax=Amycolatopsis sp. YIM 10 TaxID=2653857 RepID=UPI0012900EF8|nr:glycerate kinase [Amycolatopsis sp. YIM 10]QFU91252.1 Glycerate 2-kinase [Amycolatopsis sp. YIM 10]